MHSNELTNNKFNKHSAWDSALGSYSAAITAKRVLTSRQLDRKY